MSRDTRDRPGGGDEQQAPAGSSSDESGGAAAAAAARGPTLPAQQQAASAQTRGRGPADRERPPPLLPLPLPPPTRRANEADKENQPRGRTVPGGTPIRPAGLAHARRGPAGLADPNTWALAVGRAEAAGQGRRGGPANQHGTRLASTRPTAQAVDDASRAFSALIVRTEARRTGAGQRIQTDENAARGTSAQVEALIERLRLMGNVAGDAARHAEIACYAANTAMRRNNAMLEELRAVRATERDRIDAVAWPMAQQALMETTRSKEQCDWAVAEAEGASTVIQQAADQVIWAQDETMQRAAGQFVTRAPPPIPRIIAELRAASTRVATHEAAACTAAGRAQQAARAAEALIEQVRRILAQQSGGHPRWEVGQHTNRLRRDPPGSPGPA